MTAFWKFFFGEWYFAVPMIALSIVAFTLVFWRLLLNLDARTSLKLFLPELEGHLAKGGVAAALRFCRGRKDLIPLRLCSAGLAVASQGAGAMRRAMSEVIESDILPEMNFLLPPILAIAKIATMIGLLGTVISMIHTFTMMNDRENGPGASVQAGAIGLALFATALGLLIAVPLVFAHVMLKAFVYRFGLKMRYTAEKLIDLVHPPAAAAEADGPAAGTDALPVPATGPNDHSTESAADPAACEGKPPVNPESP